MEHFEYKNIIFIIIINMNSTPYETNFWFSCGECDGEGGLAFNGSVPGQYLAAYEEGYNEGEGNQDLGRGF